MIDHLSNCRTWTRFQRMEHFKMITQHCYVSVMYVKQHKPRFKSAKWQMQPCVTNEDHWFEQKSWISGSWISYSMVCASPYAFLLLRCVLVCCCTEPCITAIQVLDCAHLSSLQLCFKNPNLVLAVSLGLSKRCTYIIIQVLHLFVTISHSWSSSATPACWLLTSTGGVCCSTCKQTEAAKDLPCLHCWTVPHQRRQRRNVQKVDPRFRIFRGFRVVGFYAGLGGLILMDDCACPPPLPVKDLFHPSNRYLHFFWVNMCLVCRGSGPTQLSDIRPAQHLRNTWQANI